MDDNVEAKSPFKSPTGNGALAHHFESPPATFPCLGGSGRSSFELTSGNVSDENEPPSAGTSSAAAAAGAAATEHLRVNPFEVDVLAGLQTSFWSPSVMEIRDTPPKRSWAIEQLSHLFPKDIENSPSTHQNEVAVGELTENKAQADIDTYFSRGQIVPTPSPMKERVNQALHCVKLTRFSKANLTYTHCGQSPITRSAGVNMTNGLVLKKKKLTHVSVTDRWTQTALSLPVKLPAHVEEMLSEYMLQDSDMCGSSNEAVTHCSQKSEASEHLDIPDNDSGKNSSSLNNSIRRRLELSFGEGDVDDSNPLPPTSPIGDPFRRNHLMSTPPNASAMEVNTTTSELEVQLMRCEFTPETRGFPMSGTPGITPITDETDESRFGFDNACSTPKRLNGSSSFKRWTIRGEQISPMKDFPTAIVGSINGTSKVSSSSSGSNKEMRINLRRSRAGSSEGPSRKLSVASSFNDSQFLMDESSPPAKLYRRSSDKPS